MASFRNLAAGLLLAVALTTAQARADGLFGSLEQRQSDIGDFPLWLDAMERHLRDSLQDGPCGPDQVTPCHLADWLTFLEGLQDKPFESQLDQVNRYANARPYIFDIDLYGVEDYWAIPREFLPVGGDCEDFAITKFFSLRWLGHDTSDMRIVVVQDTNLRVPHAVLSVNAGGGWLILDNQADTVLTAEQIVHYTPVYSINEDAWWLHLPQ